MSVLSESAVKQVALPHLLYYVDMLVRSACAETFNAVSDILDNKPVMFALV